jgi:aminoglycoside phosphotransferase
MRATRAPDDIDGLLVEALRAVHRLDVCGCELERAAQSRIEVVQ